MATRLTDHEIREQLGNAYNEVKVDISKVHLEHLVNSYYDISYFNSVVLGRPPFHFKQFEMADTVVDHRTSVIVTGNAVGKSHFVGSAALWYFCCRPHSMVITTAPTANSLREIVWGNIRDALRKSRFPIAAKLVGSPLDKLSYSDKWYLLGLSTTKTEKMSGHHSPYVCVIADEASGVETEIYTAISSLGYDKFIMTGNPLRLDGFFYDEATRALNNPGSIGYLQIASTDGPHAHLETSPWGLACKSWLDEMAVRYGKGGIWWQSHIEGRFPDSNEDAVIPAAWLNSLAEKHKPKGPRRLAIDLSEGAGRDSSVLLVRDDNGVYEIKADNTWDYARVAQEANRLVVKYDIKPEHIVYDKTGGGFDFNNRLVAVGIRGARGFKGANSALSTSPADKMRGHAGWMLRFRLDPERKVFQHGAGLKQEPFYIPPDYLKELRPELQALSYKQTTTGKIELKSKEDLKSRLGHSPDRLDALMMSFAYQ